LQPVEALRLREPEEFYLWTDNLEAWTLFHACGTQWRVTEGQRYALDYPGCDIVMDRRRLRGRRRDRLFQQLQWMERACLEEWGKQRERERAEKGR
jgi:hypothetical protein